MTTAADLALQAALLGIKEKANIHYTQNSPARWEGIADRLLASRGQYPKYVDCSSFVTWCLGQGLWGGADILNNTSWKSGYTGTLSQHGHAVSSSQVQVGDLVFYGHPIYHVAMIIGKQNGVPIVASHGEESGPYVVKYNQWGVNSIRRYLATITPTPTPAPHPSGNPMHGHAVPGIIAPSTGNYFGLESGPNHSLGGANKSEQPYVNLIKQYLNWRFGSKLILNGIFDTLTKSSVQHYQSIYMKGKTSNPGQFWYDDWATAAAQVS